MPRSCGARPGPKCSVGQRVGVEAGELILPRADVCLFGAVGVVRTNIAAPCVLVSRVRRRPEQRLRGRLDILRLRGRSDFKLCRVLQ